MNDSPNESLHIKHVILLESIEGVKTTVEQIKAHIAFLRDLDRKGLLIMCGPFSNYAGGMIILNTSNFEEATQLASSDPFVKEGLKKFSVRTWEISNEENNHLGMG